MFTSKNDYMYKPLSPNRKHYSLKTDDIPGLKVHNII